VSSIKDCLDVFKKIGIDRVGPSMLKLLILIKYGAYNKSVEFVSVGIFFDLYFV